MKLYFYLLLLFTNNANCHPLISAFLNILDVYEDDVLNSAENETECIKQLKLYHEDLKAQKLYAAQMFDSSGKIPAGVLNANTYFVGNYDECLNIDVIKNGSAIKGQYCNAEVIPTDEVDKCVNQIFLQKYSIPEDMLESFKPYKKINWDVCFPAVCSAKELQPLWNYAAKRYDINFHVLFNDELCSSIAKQSVFPKSDQIIIGIFAAIGTICVLSTLYDVCVYQRQEEKTRHCLVAFSYYTNGKRLLTIRSNEADDSTKLTCLRGIKVISMAWIILGHRFLLNYAGTSINTTYSLEWFGHDLNMFLIGSFACVDSFFVISGCLLVYVIMIANEEGRRINLFTFYLHRFIRLSPSMIAVVLAYIGIYIHLGAGPYWHFIDEIAVRPCSEHWWETLLYIQNYLAPESRCVVQSWYLAVDTQLYVLSPLILIPLLKWPKFIISTIVGLILTSIALIVRATYVYNINSISFRTRADYYMYIYSPTEMRMGPWLVGLLLGYVMFKTKDEKIIKINKILVLFLWMLSIGSMLFIMYLYIHFFKYKFSLVTISSFFSLSRIVWGISLSWIIFACSHGFGGYINTLLSLPIFNVLARLTYSMYLTHLLTMNWIEVRRHTPAYGDNLFHFHRFWGDYVFSVGFSIVWTLTFESPISILEKSLFSSKDKKNSLDIQQMDDRPKSATI